MTGVARLRIQIFVHRIPVEVPVRTSFGTMSDRPSVLVRIEDEDGHAGWGEVWCNYPSVGAEHRARLLQSTILPLAEEIGLFDEPERLWEALTARLRILTIQTGENGPIAQCVAGLECALQDLAARRAGEPLWRFLSPAGRPDVGVYASGINPSNAPETAGRAIAEGYAGCKIKVGFNADLDRRNLIEAREVIGDGPVLMADANQAWSPDEAIAFSRDVEAARLAWLEEPIAHDEPDEEWRRIAANSTVPLAAGENFNCMAQFEELPKQRELAFLQPDVGKWGGAGKAMQVAAAARRLELTFCPHWLGGGVGLLTSLHVKAATGDRDGFVEVDFNANAIRSELTRTEFASLEGGRIQLGQAVGIGDVDGKIDAFKDHLVWTDEISVAHLP